MTPGLAAAGFSGLITIGFGREGINDGGRVCFSDFVDGDPDGSAGSGGLVVSGGNGGCDLSSLPLSGMGLTNSGCYFFGVVVMLSFGTGLCMPDVAPDDVVPYFSFRD